MCNLSNYDYNKDESCSKKDFHVSTLGNNFTTFGYGASLKSMKYCKAKKNKPIH